MQSLLEMRESRAITIEAAEAIITHAEAANRDLTAAELSDFDGKISRAEALTADIARREKLEAQRKENERVMPRVSPPWSLFDPGGAANDPNFAGRRRGSLLAFDNTAKGQEAAHMSGQWILATIFGDTRAESWCRDRGIETDFRAAHSEGVNSAGGALVPQALDSAIIALREQYGVYRRESRVIPMGTDTLSIPRRTGGLTASFTAEGIAIGESNTTWDNVNLTAKKLGALTRVSSELNEDSVIAIADLLAYEIAYSFASMEDSCGFIGDGSSSYGGMVGLAYRFENETLAGAVDATSGTDTLAEVDLADLMSVVAALPTYALPNAKWYTSQFGFATIFMNIVAAGGGNTVQTLAGTVAPNFLGFPIVVSQVLPGTGTINNSPLLYFGDLRLASTLGSRRDIRVMLSEQRYFAEDQLGIKGTERFHIVCHDLGDSSASGPICALMGNT